MDTQKSCDLDMTDAATIRAVYPAHTMKMLARLMGVPLDTARTWLYRHLSAARRRELALALIAELDRQDAEERADARRQLLEMAGGINAVGGEMGSAGDRPTARAGRAPRQAVGAVARDAREDAIGTPSSQDGGVERGVRRK